MDADVGHTLHLGLAFGLDMVFLLYYNYCEELETREQGKVKKI